MRLLLVSEFFYPYKTSTQKILTELSEDLVECGMEVSVLTSSNAYREEKQKVDKYEEYKGIKIKRVFSTSLNRDSKIGRIINYGTFTVSIFTNLLFKKEYDKILFVSNPPLIPYLGYLMKKLRKKEYVYLVHDIYPDVAEKLGVIKEKSFISKLMNKINNKIYKNADKVIVLGTDMKKVIEDKDVDTEKIEIVTNWADSKNNYRVDVENKFSEKYNMKNKFNIVYTGNISRVHAIDSILETAKLLKRDKGIQFTFVGDGNRKEYIKEIKEKENLDNIQLLDYMFGEEYNNILNSADIFISTLQKGIEGLGVPSKTYTYMSVGKPLIAIMDKKSEIGNMVSKYKLGKRFDDGEIEEIAEYIFYLKKNENEYRNIAENVMRCFEENYERKKVTKLFYENLC
ncbi:MAG: glycosyltransferase family 4 protein [Clostridium sp.]